METFVMVIAYIVVFGAAAILAVIPAALIYFVTQKKLGLLWSWFGGVVVVLCVLLSLCWHPPIFYSGDCTQNVTEEQEYAVRSVSEGVYSQRIPLIPIAIRVEEVQVDYTAWTTFYFPFGTQGMEHSADGYNCTKNLFPW